MPTYFQRPENALKRANEFIDVGKKQRALDALYDVIKSKKHRTWQKIHEPIMEKYLQLCVELRKSHIAKEGLYQYKNICQQVNIKSLEDVVRKYINLAEFKTEEARQESHQVVVDIDDLEQPDTPESLLLKVVSGEDTQDRTDRAILTPWVKFLWESYRQCLDLLRNNSRVERLYQDIAQQAFKFCFKYGRKTEFRKLCDNLRTHLSLVHKHQHQQTAINLNNPDSQAMHLETRLVQLDNAINMELWQEAFKAVEDIHGLIGLSKKPPKPSLMANYYQKLGLVFWKSGNQLFHASTLHRMFHLSREQRKNLSPEELQKMASRVLCATLAIPIPASRNAIDQLLESDEGTMEKQRRLAQLLMLQNPPKRTALIKDLVKYNVLQYVHPELQNLYQWLEVEFHPLKLHERVKSSMEFINQNDDLNQYLNSLEEIVITRVLKQVSQVYQTIEFSRLAALVPFSSKFRLERLIVETALTLELQVRIDHRSKSLSFGTDLMVAQKEDVPEGPYIQSMPSEQIRNQLTSMSRCLHKAMTLIQPEDRQSIRDELRVKIANSYRMTAKKDHVNVLQRRHIIEERKEQLEHMNDQREREEMEQQEEQKKKAYDAEMARLEREAKERERQRKVEEHKEMQKKHAQERIEQLRKTELGAKVLQNLDEDDFATLDIEDIMAKQVEQLEKEKKELNERLKSQEKKIDFFARAKRLEEIPLLKKQYDSDRQELKGFWEQQEEERIEKVKKERENALQQRDRLSRMKKDRDEFVNMLRGKRKEQFKQKVKEFDLKMSEERKKRLADRKEKRKEDRRTKWIEEKREAEQRAKDEELLREREEKEQMEKERIEKEEEEYKEKIRKLEEQSAKQRAREMEIEEREKRRREELGSGGGRPGGAPEEGRSWKPLQKDGGLGWREREKQRADSWKRDPDAPPQRGDEPPDRDDRDGWRGRGTPSRDERPPPARDDRPSARDDRGPPGDAWRDRRDDRGPPPVESAWGRDRVRDDRGPPGDAWGRDRNRDDRGPPGESWRDRGKDDRGPPGGSWRDRAAARDSERGPPREFDRGPSRDFDRGPSRDFDRGPSRDFDRGPSRDFDRGPSRDDRGPRDFRNDRGTRDFGPSRDIREDRGPPSRDYREDRGPSRDDREERGPWRRGGDSDRFGGGSDSSRDDKWGSRDRPSERSREDRGPPSRDDRGPPPQEREDTWRKGGGGGQSEGGPPKTSWRDKQPEKERKPGEGDEGWTTVKY
ncbi:eukaryotic translation initiation factor 3 subunit A-like [Mytilus californianus]|uniref:eukaryotic translation initiation factor 3 subunit A-like n=1 Tax=Mytilus californianus TaxID=6549 RepID=UPI0022455CBB|nr:eukaryotic translation initiation factor 3 subunit A-like [Mytilus californianus]